MTALQQKLFELRDEKYALFQSDELVCKPIKRGKSPTYTSKSGTLVFAQKCNTKKGYIDISLALYLDESKLSKYLEEEFMKDKDIVVNSTGGGTMGCVGFYQNVDNPNNIPIVPDSHVTTVRKRFPGDMQKSLLQMAIQGNLVEQRPEEGTGEQLYQQIRVKKQVLIKAGKIKKDKPLPEISDDEKPFDILESWKWVQLGNLCDVVTGRLDANAQKSDGEYAFFTCGVEVYKTDSYTFDCDAVLLGGNNASGDYKMHRYNGKFNAYQRVYVITGQPTVALDYIYYVIKYWLPYLKKGSQGTTTRFIKLGKVTGMAIPLPPLAEQKRIVAKLEELLPLCERLK